MEKKVGRKRRRRAWRCSSVVEHFPSKHKTLNSIPMDKKSHVASHALTGFQYDGFNIECHVQIFRNSQGIPICSQA